MPASLYFSWEQQKFRTAAAYVPGGSPAIYDYDMATLPADATAEHPQDSVKATAVMGARRWGDVDSAASGLQLLDDADYKDKDSLRCVASRSSTPASTRPTS